MSFKLPYSNQTNWGGLVLVGPTAAPAVVSDPYFEYTTLLLPGNGTNGAQNNTFLDSSTNNFTITRNGNTTQGTFSPFSQTGWGNYFDGTGDYLTVADNTALEVPTQDFTIEAWVYLTSLPSSGAGYTVIQKGRTGTSDFEYSFEIENNAGNMRLVCRTSSNGTSLTTASGNTISLAANTWYHVAVTRTTTTASFWFEGVAAGSGTVNSTTYTGAATVGLFANNAGSSPLVGYASNLRLVKGVAVYTGAFTPPTSPLAATQSAGTNISAITGTQTSLLTCQSNRFIDNSSNNFTITVNGNTSVVAFSPFNPTASWSAAANGGSGYFDGSGDYLSIADNAAFNLNGTSFCIEGWVYPTSLSGYQTVISKRSAVWELGTNNSNLYFYNGTVYTGSIALQTNTWTHVAVTNDGTNLRMFVNGVVDQTLPGVGAGSGASSITIGFATAGFPQYWPGYISNLRVVKGSPVYTTAFTPPTAPLTAITNTSLLLNFTNAGVYDATSKNDLETVGDAQISNTTAKWGSTSIKFDGTGDYLITPTANQNFSLGATFTIEFWIYNTKTSGFGGILGHTGTNWYTGVPITYVSGGASTFTLNSYAGFLSKPGLNNNTWYYVAIVANNNQASLYINGVLQSGPITQAVTGTPAYFTVGRHDGTNSIGDWSGYIQDLRITKGIARTITASPTAAFPTL